MSAPRIAIVGAGIAGLTAALAFARKGAEVTLVEQAEELSAVGAGLQLSPNACHVMHRLGLLPQIEARWQETDHVALVSGIDLRQLATVPAGAFARRRWNAPYGALARADLQAVLVDAVSELPNCRLVLGHRMNVANAEDLQSEITAITGSKPELIAGADGVRSRMRQVIRGHGATSFSGYIAWRTTAPLAALGELPVKPGATTALLGPSAHLVAYPLAAGHSVNLVAVTSGSAAMGDQAEDGSSLTQAFARWHPAVRKLLAASGERPTGWPLYEVSDGSWRAGRLILIGDAAHAMMPFAAQGAAMAIEDAFELVEAFTAGGSAALDGFVRRRKQRVARVRRRTAFNRFAYHAGGALRIARDLALASRGPERLAADLDWLYGYRPIGDA